MSKAEFARFEIPLRLKKRADRCSSIQHVASRVLPLPPLRFGEGFEAQHYMQPTAREELLRGA
jgi:hypothetical protein